MPISPFPWSLHPQDGSLAWVPLTSLPGSIPGLGLVTPGCGPLSFPGQALSGLSFSPGVEAAP